MNKTTEKNVERMKEELEKLREENKRLRSETIPLEECEKKIEETRQKLAKQKKREAREEIVEELKEMGETEAGLRLFLKEFREAPKPAQDIRDRAQNLKTTLEEMVAKIEKRYKEKNQKPQEELAKTRSQEENENG